MKLLGCVLVLLASIGYAWQTGRELKEHVKLLYEIRKLLSDIEAEASYTMAPMEVILTEMAGKYPPVLGNICAKTGSLLRKREMGSGSGIWERVVHDAAGELGLTEEEQELFEEAGNAFFGKSLEENEKNYAHYMERLGYVTNPAREERWEKQKVHQTISIMCGLFVILLLL